MNDDRHVIIKRLICHIVLSKRWSYLWSEVWVDMENVNVCQSAAKSGRSGGGPKLAHGDGVLSK